MKWSWKTRKTVVLLLLSGLLYWVSGFSSFLEQYYSEGVYPFIGRSLRFLSGWLPFSLGDLLYAGLMGYLMIKLVKLVRLFIQRKAHLIDWRKKLHAGLNNLLALYLLFYLIWGLNYNRLPVDQQFELKEKKYSADDLRQLNGLLVEKINASKSHLLLHPVADSSYSFLFGQANEAYRQLAKAYPHLQYAPRSVKSSLWGWAGNYLGFLGYYNPFTGEAQVNTGIPAFLQPFTICHEMAHQLGYAKENEANFVGYLAASQSSDSFFQYSTYLDLFLYANRNLYGVDSAKANASAQQLLPEVKNDLRYLSAFYKRHRNPIEPIVRWLYGFYLRQNRQPSGIMSYDEVTGLVIAHYKKTGKL